MAFGLNSRQKSATTSQSRHTLVSAGPGTGKTAVLAGFAKQQASRFMARSACSEGRKPRVLVLTHTINARDRVQSRVNEMEPDLEVRQLISCMTFHGFALKMVNHYGKSRYVVDENFEIDTVRKIISRKRFRNQINPKHAQDIVDINEARPLHN